MESKAAKDEKGMQPDSTPKIIYLTDEARAQRIVKCPYCGEEVSTDAKRCNHCGRQIEISTESTEKSPQDRPVNFDSLGYVKSALASKYQVIEEVAKTDTSTVFRAIHLQLRREVALKVLLKHTAQDRDFTDRFHRRARAIDKLSQNNIITIFDEGVDNGAHYMAMEFLKGVDLQRKISEDGPLSPEELVSILMPAIGGLGHAHSNGILHGNIKCSSIFLHDDGRIILFGFGIPYLTKGNLISFKRDPNSIEYLSPEEASGKSVDGRSDIYSLGVVMYYALTGRFPHTGLDSGTTITAIISHQYVPISKLRSVPQWLERIVDKCLQRDISKRVQSCAELLGMLNASPAVRSGQPGFGMHPSRETTPSQPTGEKLVDVKPKIPETARPTVNRSIPPANVQGNSFNKQNVPPSEAPAKDESLAEEPTVEFSASEEIPSQVVKDEPRQSKQKPVTQQAKPEANVEKKVEKRSGSKALVWVFAFVIIGIAGAALTIMIMNKSQFGNVSVVPAPGPKQVETTSEANSRPAANQENAGNAAKPTDQNLGQTEPTATTGQGVISSPESSTPAPVQSVAKTQETPSPEKNTPAESKRAVKSSASSNKRATGYSSEQSAFGGEHSD